MKSELATDLLQKLWKTTHGESLVLCNQRTVLRYGVANLIWHSQRRLWSFQRVRQGRIRGRQSYYTDIALIYQFGAGIQYIVFCQGGVVSEADFDGPMDNAQWCDRIF